VCASLPRTVARIPASSLTTSRHDLDAIETGGFYRQATPDLGKLRAYGYFFRHVDGVTIRGPTIVLQQAGARPVTSYRDALHVEAGGPDPRCRKRLESFV
jgi:hypothetical protein